MQKQMARYSDIPSYRPGLSARSRRQQPSVTAKKRHWKLPLAILLVALVAVSFTVHSVADNRDATTKSNQAATTSTKKSTKTPVVAAPVNHCSGNTLSQYTLVSISQRHLWACNADKQLYDSPVITGMQQIAADATPPGTYKVYAKATDLHLRGSDSTGSWDDPVSYWMPFLDNQYGTYGFHDATWRPDSQFGNVDPNSNQGSHGCVELPLATAAWLYNWASVGLTVTVEA